MTKQQLHWKNLLWLWICVFVILVDQCTKYMADSFLLLYHPHPVLPFFNLTLAYNRGAAFSFLNGQSGWQNGLFITVATILSFAITVWLLKTPKRDRFLLGALALILGGSLGNLWDRIQLGFVVDFLDLYALGWHFPAFNVADMAIFLGAVMVAIDILFRKKQ